MAEQSFDVVVVGAGPAGEVLAGRLAERGHEVAILESHLVGGECSFYGCMPSKALLRPAELLAEARRVPGAAEAIAGDVDVHAVLRRRDQIVAGLAEARPWTNREATTSPTVPSRLLVLGGGVVGVESAQIYASLGSRVTLLEALPRLLAREQPEVADLLHAATIAVVAAVPMPVLLEAVAPFPTRSEIWLKLLERYESECGAGALAPAA